MGENNTEYDSGINELIEHLEKEKYLKKRKLAHTILVLNWVRTLCEGLKYVDEKKLIQYAAVLHDIGKSEAIEKEYCKIRRRESDHPIIGSWWLNIHADKKVNEILNKHDVSSDLEYIILLIENHNNCDTNSKGAQILIAADKLAHIMEDPKRYEKSVEKINMLSWVDVQVMSLRAAKKLNDNRKKCGG